MDQVRAYVDQRRAEHEAELAAWIAVPSVSTTGEDMTAAAGHATELVRRSGLTPAVVETGGWPLVTGHVAGPPGSPHVVIYGHYDVQPPGPLDEWDSPPFQATVRDGRVYGRGTGDNKGQHLAQLLALRALRDTGTGMPCTVTVLLDGEEEIGSPNLGSTLAGMRAALAADLVVWSDGPVHDSGEPTLVLGVRGIVSFEIVVRGADAPLHSGNWGGVAPNPAWELVWLLNTIRTPDGRIAVDGFDAGATPLTAAERLAMDALPVDVPATLAGAGLDRMDAPAGLPFSDRLALPTFTINSLTCLDGGDHRTVIPAAAVAKCDMRLVGGQRGDTALAALRAHLAKHLPHAELRLTRGVMEASRTLPGSPYTDVILGAMTGAYGRKTVLVPALGGSLPIAALSDGLGLPCYGVPLANVDERNHAPNENMELDRFHDGIVACAAVLTELGRQRRMNSTIDRSASAERTFTDLLAYDRIGDLAPSPAFDRLALVRQGDQYQLEMVALTGEPGSPRPLPQAPDGVNRCVWHPAGDRLLVTVDPTGAEHDQIAELDASTGALLWATDQPQAVHAIGPIKDDHPRPYHPSGTSVAYCNNVRDPEGLDVIVRDLTTGAETIVLRGDDRHYPVDWSPDGEYLLVKRIHQNTEHDLFRCHPATGEVRQLTVVTARYQNAGWTADGSGIVLLTDAGRDLMAPAVLDVATGELRWLVGAGQLPDEVEVSGLALTRDRRHLAWGFVRDGQSHWFLDELTGDGTSAGRAPVRSMPHGALPDEMGKNGHVAVHLGPGGRAMVGRLDQPTVPSDIVLIDVAAGSRAAGVRRLTDFRGQVPVADLVEPTYVRIANRDGHRMQAQLFRPAHQNAGRVPVVVMVHGGPESAHPHEYLPEVQALLRAGFGVLAPDIRGSVGYGRAFQRLHVHDWGGGDVRDVLDCVAYLETLPWVDTGRLGIMGGSYGGFLTLACIAQHPSLWRAAVDIFGPSDLVMDAGSVPPHWRRRVTGWIGDTSDPTDLARLVEHSPINHAERITTPLLVVQGAHDPRVQPKQSNQMVDRLRELDRPVELIEMADEGHGFASRTNFNRVNLAAVEWFRRYL